MRLTFIGWILSFTFLFLDLGLFNLAVLKGKRYYRLSEKNCIRLLPQEGARGRILDRRGEIIVDNQLFYDVMVMTQSSNKAYPVLSEISPVLNISLSELKENFNSNLVAPFVPVTVASNIDVRKAIVLEELKSDIGNIVIQPRPVRRYPYGRTACHIIGYLNEIDHRSLTSLEDYGYQAKDIVGFGGVEEKYDYYLRPSRGGLSVEVDSRGKFVRVLGLRPPGNGRDIQLTLDLKIQKIVEGHLAGRVGAVILMDPSSGEVIAMASSPNFDPTVFIRKSRPCINSLLNDPGAPFINRAISGLYPPGSVFKLVVASAALDTKKITLSKTFFCPGKTMIGRREFKCWDTHNDENLFAAITHSCDVFFYKTGLLVGAQTIHDYALRFGFARPTSIDLPYEAGGFVPSALWKKAQRLEKWFDGDTANFAIGQGDLLVTPLQIARMVAVFANKGYLVKPYIVKSIGGQDISVYKKAVTGLKLHDGRVDYIARAMRNVVLDPTGTANIVEGSGVAVAGKTGTVQVPRGQPHAWFVGFFPYKEPKYVICVFLEHGGSGQASCVLAKQIIGDILKEGLI